VGRRAAPGEERDVDAWQAVVLAVVALLVGALLPAVVQLTLTLKALRAAAERTEGALVSITATAERIDRITARLEEGGRVDNLLGAVDSFSRTVTRLQETARVVSAVGAAVGPAMGAAMRAWRESRDDGVPPADGAGAASPEPEREERTP
jgi:hypothetical protein